MRRVLFIAATAVTLVLGATPAHADKPMGSCPSDMWHQSVFPLNWQPGDQMDPNGDNLLLQIGIAGIIEEFGSLEAGLAAFGFTTLDELYAAAVDPGYNKIDKNDDGVLCAKPFPSQSNKPAYLANAVDNTAQSSR